MALDPNVFNNLKTFEDYARAEQEFQQRKQLANAQLLTAQAAIAKAGQVDADKLGEQAFLKAAQGMEISQPEAAALKYLDAKQQTMTFNPVTGAMEQKPSLLARAGLQFEQPQAQPQQAPAPTRQPAPAPAPSGGANIGDVFTPEQNVMPEQPKADSPELMQELSKYPNNPKMQQSIRETYAKNQINAVSPENIFKFENTLRDEFSNTTKDFRTVQDAYSKILKTSGSGAGDMSMLYAYVKLLDPGSVVRESEFATAAASGSLGERVQGAVKSIMEGGRLPPEQRQEFLNEAARIYEGQKEGYERTIETYKGLASRNKLNPENIVTDYRQLNPAKPQQEQPALPKMGSTMQGTDGNYVFIGGDPSKPESWKKIK